MKTVTVILLLLFTTAGLKAGDPYRIYLLTKVNDKLLTAPVISEPTNTRKEMAIPRYRIPAGAVFCRLEDKLTKATKVWVKIGVE